MYNLIEYPCAMRTREAVFMLETLLRHERHSQYVRENYDAIVTLYDRIRLCESADNCDKLEVLNLFGEYIDELKERYTEAGS